MHLQQGAQIQTFPNVGNIHVCIPAPKQRHMHIHQGGGTACICVRCKHRDGVSSDSCLSDVDCRVCRVFTWKKHSRLPQCAVQPGETDTIKNSMRNVKKTPLGQFIEPIKLNKWRVMEQYLYITAFGGAGGTTHASFKGMTKKKKLCSY